MSKEAKDLWMQLIDWMLTQDKFVVIGLTDGEINVRSTAELDEAFEMVAMVYDSLETSLESGAPGHLQSLQ